MVGNYVENCLTPNDKLPKFNQHSTSTQYENTNDQENDNYEGAFIILQNIELRVSTISNLSFRSE